MVTKKSATTPANIIPENTKNVNGDSKNVSDERKSVKRSYMSGEESELEKDTTLFLWLATEYERSQYCKN